MFILLTQISQYDWRSVLGKTLVNINLVTKIVEEKRRDTTTHTMIYFDKCEPILVKETITEIEGKIKI